MEVILLEKIEKLGGLGDVVKVKSGFGRNYLIPQGRALPATRSNQSTFEAERAEHEKRQDEVRAAAEALSAKAVGVAITLTRPAGNSEKLFGSVTNADIAAFYKGQGIDVPRRVIELTHPIRTLGEHEIKLRFHSDVVTTVTVLVERAAL